MSKVFFSNKSGNKSPNQWGFTILETIIVMLLFALCLSVISTIIVDYTKSIKYIRNKENVQLGMRVGIQHLANELREANELLSPENVGDSDNQVLFKRREPPFLSSDYENDRDKNDYGFFLKNPQNESPYQKIKYVAENGKLLRKCLDDQDNEVSSSIIIDNVNCLNVTKVDEQALEIVLTIKENKTFSDIRTQVQIRGKI